MKTSRQRLLSYLEKKQVATAHEISLALKMTSANARHHLSILMDQGSVEFIGKRPGPGRGRPHNLYRAVKSNKKSNLTRLTNTLFRVLFNTNHGLDQDAVLKSIADRIIGNDISESLNQVQLLNEAVIRLNHMNYEARWEAHKDAPHVIFNNCPYRDIVDEVPLICRVDQFILEIMLSCPVNQTAKLEKSPQGMQRCIFFLKL